MTEDEAEQMLVSLRDLSIQIRKERALDLSQKTGLLINQCQEMLMRYHEDYIVFLMSLSEKRRDIFTQFGRCKGLRTARWLDKTLLDDEELLMKLKE